jgi:hypothetical protein
MEQQMSHVYFLIDDNSDFIKCYDTLDELLAAADWYEANGDSVTVEICF